MPLGRSLTPLVRADEQRGWLQSQSLSASVPLGTVRRARITLGSAEGLTRTSVGQ